MKCFGTHYNLRYMYHCFPCVSASESVSGASPKPQVYNPLSPLRRNAVISLPGTTSLVSDKRGVVPVSLSEQCKSYGSNNLQVPPCKRAYGRLRDYAQWGNSRNLGSKFMTSLWVRLLIFRLQEWPRSRHETVKCINKISCSTARAWFTKIFWMI